PEPLHCSRSHEVASNLDELAVRGSPADPRRPHAARRATGVATPTRRREGAARAAPPNWSSLSTASEAAERRAAGDRDRGDEYRARRHELEDGFLDGYPHDVRDDHWKISVVQSPPCRRISCARAGPSGRSWKSTKKSRSTSMPPFGSQSIRKSQERSSG